MPSVHDKHHEKLEQDVTALLENLGFLVDASTYHESMRKDTVARLKNVNTPTAFYVRGKADRIAVHKHRDICFMWEAKTNSDPRKRRNAAFEAMPLATHMKHGQRCLYVYRDIVSGFEGGFSVNRIPPVSRILMPKRWGTNLVGYFTETLEGAFPGTPISEINWRPGQGSGDPFVLVEEENLKSQEWFDWKDSMTKCVQTTQTSPVGGAAPRGASDRATPSAPE